MFSTITIYATHIVGAELTYKSLGGDQYRVTLKVYRDCSTTGNPNGTGFDPAASIGVFNTNNELESSFSMTNPTVSSLPVIVTNPCLQVPPVICTEEAIYVRDVTLSVPTGGLNLVYQRCCRNTVIQNINTPEDMGSTSIAHIPSPSLAINNNGAHFINIPPLLLCNGDALSFDHSAFDPDGDVLVYELCTPWHGASSSNPRPQPPNAGPYSNISWAAGFGVNNQINGTQNLAINSSTGELICTPTTNGVYVVGICVKEYRNGQLINTTLRDFQFTVVSCSSTVISAVPDQSVQCDGFTMDFTNQSTNGSFYHWDFGVTGVQDDTSILEEPTYTYPDTGVYEVTLIANPGWPCADTSKANYLVQYPIQANIQPIAGQCLRGNSFGFGISGNFTNSVSFEWSFDDAATPNFSTNQFPTNITYDEDGLYSITATVFDRGCERDFTVEHLVYPMPEAIIPTIENCNGLTINTINNSTQATKFEWDFGDLSTSLDTSSFNTPSYTYPNSGTYNVSLIASNVNCVDTAFTIYKVKEPINPMFNFNLNPQCITTNSFDFSLSGNYTNAATFSWDFDDNSLPSNSTLENPTNIVYTEEGYYPVTATVVDEGCTAVVVDTAKVFPSPDIQFSISDTIGCMPLSINFIDESIAWGDVDYLWDFGNGVTSTVREPIYTYENPGVYDVTFSLTTNEGCLETLRTSKSGVIIVYPRPVADFTVTPQATTIYFPEVQISDFSTGDIVTQFYEVEGSTLNGADVTYSLQTSGNIPIRQTVINGFGCDDTLTKFVYVEPDDVMYIPNTFTPNNDGVNDFFKPVSFGVLSFEFYVFNRWGDIIYEGNEFSTGWDGTNKKGNIVQDEAYTWKIRYKDHDNKSQNLNGHVVLLK